MIQDVFKRLWKLVFNLDIDRCRENREVNYLALVVFFTEKQQLLTSDIESDADYFSDVRFGDSTAMPFHGFLRRFPNIYSLLTDAGKVGAKNFANAEPSRKLMAWYLFDSVSEHADAMLEEFSDSIGLHLQSIRRLGEELCRVGDSHRNFSFGIDCYSKSGSYDYANRCFESLVRPFLDSYERSDLPELIEKANQNSQVFDRRDAYRDHSDIRDHLDRTECSVEDFRDFHNIAGALFRVGEF